MRRIAVAAVLLMALLTGCGEPVSGTVVNKVYRPYRIETRMVPMWNGESVTMTTQIFGHPEQYMLLVEDDNGNHWVSVSEIEYSGVEVGDWFNEE